MTLLACVFVLAGCVWIGGLVAIAVVARAATATLGAADRVGFFRALGRAYGVVGGAALAVALGTGGALAAQAPGGPVRTAAVAVAAALVVATVVGVVQARRMTRLRRQALGRPQDTGLVGRVGSGAHRASALRALIALLSLALMVLAVLLAR